MVGFLGTVIGMVNVFLDMEAAGTVQSVTFRPEPSKRW